MHILFFDSSWLEESGAADILELRGILSSVIKQLKVPYLFLSGLFFLLNVLLVKPNN